MSDIKLTPVIEKFILHWGEMGTKWGINRTVAQIHALLYIWPEPLNAEQIADTLSVARSNVSTSIRELQGWGIVKTVNILGDRRDHFESIKEVWELFEIIMTERKKREIDPTVAMLRECVEQIESDNPTDVHTRARLKELLGFFETMTGWYEQMRRLPTKTLMKFVTMGGKFKQWLTKAG